MSKLDNLILKSEQLGNSLESLGIINGRSSRLHYYIRYIQKWLKVHNTSKQYDYAKGFRVYKFLYAIQELNDLVFIDEHLLRLYKKFPKELQTKIYNKLKIVFSGVAFTEDEKNTSARDTEFELFLAAKLCQKGYTEINFYERPDVTVTISNRVYGFECKRITRNVESRMIKRADEGAEQLSKSNVKLFSGIVALDLSAFTIDNSWNIGSTKREIKKYYWHHYEL